MHTGASEHAFVQKLKNKPKTYSKLKKTITFYINFTLIFLTTIPFFLGNFKPVKQQQQ
jgi:hypothetical protein